MEKLLVTCEDGCNVIRTTRQGRATDIHSLPQIKIGREYTVIKIVEANYKQYYMLAEFPANHLFETKAFSTPYKTKEIEPA